MSEELKRDFIITETESKESPSEIQEEQPRWERLKLEEEEQMASQYAKETELASETRKTISKLLSEIAEQKRIEFVDKWCKNNIEVIKKEKGRFPDVEDQSKKAVSERMVVARRMGAFDQLKTDGQYAESGLAINQIYMLKEDLERDLQLLETPREILFLLQQRAEYLRGQDQSETVKYELEQLDKVRFELADKLSGKDIREEVGTGVKEANKFVLGEEKDYISANVTSVEDRLKVYFTDGDINTEQLKDVFQIDTKPRGIIRKKEVIILKDKDGVEVLGEFQDATSVKDFVKRYLDTEYKELVKQKSKEWKEKKEEWEKETAKKIKDKIEKRMKEYSGSGRSVDDIKDIFTSIREQLADEAIIKLQTERREILKEFEGEGKDPTELVKAVLSREDEDLKQLTGDEEKDWEWLESFFQEQGIEFPSLKGKMDKRKEAWLERMRGTEVDIDGKKLDYKKAVRKRRGFADWMLNFMFGIKPKT